MSIFSNLTPELTPEHTSLRRKGIKVQREAMETLVVKWGGLISSAIRTEMVTSNCTYEEACVQLVRACDHMTAQMYLVEMGDYKKPD